MLPLVRRPKKFTAEVIEQIKNLVERGKSRDEIAELVGVTTGSLQVTCSRIGVSLRRTVLDNGIKTPRRAVGNGLKSVPQNNDQRTPAASDSGNGSDNTFSISVVLRHKGRERSMHLPLTQDAITRLAFEAEARGLRIGQLLSEIITVVVGEEDLIEAVLRKKEK